MAFFPVFEWLIHVVILHWRPRKVGGVTVDSILARKHRAHHADPRDLPLVFIPWQASSGSSRRTWRSRCSRSRGRTAGPTFMVAMSALMFNYEWVHFLVHSDYRPRAGPYARCGTTTGCTTTRTSTTGSPSPRRARPTGCSAPTPTAARCDLEDGPQAARARGWTRSVLTATGCRTQLSAEPAR